MLELTQLIQGLAPALETNVGILVEIIKGIYCISSGGVTMKNISRWTDKGASYRSIQRFFSCSMDWLSLNVLLFRTAYMESPCPMRYILALDETVKGKAGKHTFGVNWFYSSIAGRVIRSVSNHVISIVDTKKEKSFVLGHKQNVKPANKPEKKRKGKAKAGSKSKAKAGQSSGAKRKAGRPKGSKNKQNVKKQGLLYESFELLLGLALPLLEGIGLGIRYVVGDGAYGNKTCCLVAQQFGLCLISKLNRNTALYLPYQGPYSGKGRRKKYGDKIDYQDIPEQYLTQSITEGGIRTMVYQIKGVWTKQMPCLINVVIIVKINLETQKAGRVVLFSTDLTLEASTIIRFYSLRFQIEFNFRDAKQYFGLADFKNVKEQQVDNAVGLSLFMDNVSLVLMEQAKTQWNEETVSIQDIKAYFRAEKYLHDILNTLEIGPNSIIIQQEFEDILKIGAINRTGATKMAG